VGRGYSDISHHEYSSISGLDHQPQERVDLVLPVAEVSALHKVVGLLPPAPGRVVELEGPQEVGGVLEVGADGEDLVDEVLHADDAHLAELGLDHLVGGDGGAVAVNLDKAALVDEVTHGLEVGAAVGDVGLSIIFHKGKLQTKWPEWACGRGVTSLRLAESPILPETDDESSR